MATPSNELFILHFTIHDVYDRKGNGISLHEEPYIKFYWKSEKYKNYLKLFSDEINWFCEFFLPYKSGDYVEKLVMQIWVNGCLKRKRKVSYNYININDVEKKKKINGKTELIGKRKGLKVIYSLQIIYYSLYMIMKNAQTYILNKISIYKMMQIYRSNQRDTSTNDENILDKYIISLFQKESYMKKNTPLQLKNTFRVNNTRNNIKNDFQSPHNLKLKKKKHEQKTSKDSLLSLSQKNLNEKTIHIRNKPKSQKKSAMVQETVKGEKIEQQVDTKKKKKKRKKAQTTEVGRGFS
ncbi:hypothetical protein, conserved [Plasmodium gonderi]|uniref:Uncharacterized protein n=1 Tax=Plasmodium gonderi TaxID=77519 RepID=A0A1Y1JKJ3_PLAGO|nr:hypothetical protein, conserved [Plasmodium gonderi]GAW81707.1 hypothetical protein, conserved [Plasmodium gonderi]